jgi:hypothetical protein
MFEYIIGYNNPAAGGGVDLDRDWAADMLGNFEEFELLEGHARKHGHAYGSKDLTILYKKG